MKNNQNNRRRVEMRIISREINFDIIGKFVDGVLVSTRKMRTFGF